jgi:hypothetical protein
MKGNTASTKPSLLGTRRESKKRNRKAKVNTLAFCIREMVFA